MIAQEPYKRLMDALRERLGVIQDHEFRQRDPSGQLLALQAASEKLAQLQRELPPNADPRLVHFLERCSYDKALAWLQEQTF